MDFQELLSTVLKGSQGLLGTDFKYFEIKSFQELLGAEFKDFQGLTVGVLNSRTFRHCIQRLSKLYC